MSAITGLASRGASVKRACQALNCNRASYYRAIRVKRPSAPRPPAPRSLTPQQRDEVRQILTCPRFVDASPRSIVQTLIDEGVYVCSWRTMFRELKKDGSARERRNQTTHPAYAKPELLATAPNQVWSWDITKLRGPQKLTYFHLYVMLDIFSRYVVGWMLARSESSELAKRFISETQQHDGVDPTVLTLHSDRGSPMRAKSVAQLCAELDLTQSFSRPHVSDDNPYSESAFKTVKYHPNFPDRFSCFNEAREFCVSFFDWYNNEHRHSGIAFLTPAVVHHGHAEAVVEKRQGVLDLAFARMPHRFAGRRPIAAKLPSEVWINRPITSEEQVLVTCVVQ